MNNPTILVITVFMFLYGLVFIGAGFLSLKSDMGWGENYVNALYYDVDQKKKFKAKINRLVGSIFIVLGSIIIIAAALMLIML